MSIPAPKRSAMSSAVIAEVSAIVSRITGVQLGERQRTMVETRLMRRISELGLASEQDYVAHLRADVAGETEALVSLLTTHHTFFFREYQHFEYLEAGALAAVVKAVRASGRSSLRVWSAACSRGQEVYTLAMFLADKLPAIDRGMSFEIFGSDVDKESVAVARNGVYHARELTQVPAHYLADHWAKGTGDIAAYVRAKRSLRAHCTFQDANLLDQAAFKAFGQFDLILCRNVFIYFTPDQIAKIARSFATCLAPHGNLLIGISESLSGLDVPFTAVGPSVYAPRSAAAKAASPSATAAPVLELVRAKPLRVVCVDDSPSVLAVLKQVLGDKHGFQVVGTAGSGLEAADKIASLKPDLVTLDIHMPEMTGLAYLQKHWTKAHPPVVMVSSVAREDAALALSCLRAGAVDYVEKPALATLSERGDELRLKLSCAARRPKDGAAPTAGRGFDAERATSLSAALRPGTRRLLLAGLGDTAALAAMLRELRSADQAVTILTDGLGDLQQAMADDLARASGRSIGLLAAGSVDLSRGMWLGDLRQHWPQFIQAQKPADTSIFIFGGLTAQRQALLGSWRGAQIYLEDLPQLAGQPAPAWVTDVAPATSYMYMSHLFLSRTGRTP